MTALSSYPSSQDQEGPDAPAAGTPLSAVATPAADTGHTLERLSAHVELEDGTSWDALVLNRDFVAFDLTRPKRGWPAGDEAPFLLNNFLAWNASKRAGHPVGGFDGFVNAAEVVKLTQAEPARPTRPEAGPGSS